MKKNAIPIGPVTLFGALIIVAAVFLVWWSPYSNNLIVTDDTIEDNTAFIGKPLPHFASEEAIIAAFKEAQALMSGGFGREGVLIKSMDSVAENTAPSATAGGGMDYSTTNVQVEGVDEADIVKTDGEYIYTLYKKSIKIVHAVPAEEAKVVSTIALDDLFPQEMLINGDTLLVFGTKQDNSPYPMDGLVESRMIMPDYYPYYGYSYTAWVAYDISDRTHPSLVKELLFRGNYVTSRMIGNEVYAVITTYPDYRVLQDETVVEGSIIPMYIEDGIEKSLALPTEIGYVPPVYAQNFITVVSLNTETLEIQKETIVGDAQTVYSSQDNLYIAHTQWYDPIDWPKLIEESISGNILPQPASMSVKTIINKFHLDNGKITFAGQGKVPGNVLNQFSMDEFDNHFRIATTTEPSWGFGIAMRENTETGPMNNVYVLDSDMEIVGRLEDLAPGERIYSARFMGERVYLVTFKQVDPLFVIDLSNPSNPHVLGKLKIPGYSNYLHPIDATHIIGIGKDTTVGKNETAYYLGMKLAIFDVSDVENPIQLHSLNVGDRGTDSYALNDHKAFLYDKEKELMVLPIYLYEISEKQQGKPIGDWPEYGVPTYQGAFVYHVDLTNGFEELGRITHIDSEIDLKSGYYYDYSYQVKRSLYIGDVLYTISDKIIKANHLTDLSEIKLIELSNTPKDFTIYVHVGGGLCPTPCGYQEATITSQKISTKNVTGGENGYTNTSEYPSGEQYVDLIDSLDWELFQSLDSVIGCPSCADGLTETITITKGGISKTVKFEVGTNIEGLNGFLNLLNGYVGIYDYPIYASEGGMGITVSTPQSVDS
ncbi:MAG: beta-propeller domain-containing protein [Candidatus Diapherotrites archaeon]